MAIDAEKFLENLQAKSRPKERTQSHANRMSLVSDSMRGTVTFLPVIPDGFNNSPFMELKGVKETNIVTSQNNKGFGWSYILPIECYGELTLEEKKLYNEVSKLWDKVHELNPNEYTYQRSRKYTLMTGILMDHYNTSGTQVKDHLGKPTLFCFPSLSVAKSVSDSITAKIQAMKGNTSIINLLFNNDPKGRKSTLSVSFKLKGGSAIGYDASTSINFNSDFEIAVDPEKDFGEDNIKLLMNPLEIFLMWNYDHELDRPFSTKTFNEIKDSLTSKLEVLSKKSNTETETTKSDAATATSTSDVPF